MELKKTLIMPKGSFEMRANLPSKEPLILERLNGIDIYHELLKKNEGKKPFYLHDGPPYANNDIHAGHALNKVVKDITIRYKNLKGFYCPNVPGWDTHGLPIENAVTKAGANRRKMSAVDFRKLCEEYALKQVDKQRNQMRRLGIISDFDNPYLTLQPEYEKAQIEVFAKMALKGYIYRGLKPVNWSYSSETALAEAEIEYKDVEANTIYVTFKCLEARGPIKKGDAFVIWTTTPWTIPANLAISLNPELDYGIFECDQGRLIFLASLADDLIEKLHLTNTKLKAIFKGQKAENLKTQHPLYDRSSVVLLGDHVTADAGTGAVHTAPGHGLDDYKVCQKYGIEPFCPVDANGKMTSEAGERLAGLFYEDANDLVITMLKESGSLLHEEKLVHSYPHDWRTGKPLIFRATTQWFASLNQFKDQLLSEIEKVSFTPKWGLNRLHKMIENREDWCISRQRAWGVPIPIIYCEDGTPIIEEAVFDNIARIIGKEGSSVWFAKKARELLPEGYKNEHSPNGIFTKEKDIMDVWFDSGSSFLGVNIGRGLPFPADLYLEGNDQYRGWYNASLILSVATKGVAPFKKIVTHGMMVDANGVKFSKSLGNGVDPLKICSTYGADIFRLWAASVDFTSETKLSEELIKITSETYRKIRNTLKFMLANLYDGEEYANLDSEPSYSLIDKLIINQLAKVLKEVDEAYNKLDYNVAIMSILNFVINDLSAFYLDISKDILYCDKKDGVRRKAVQSAFLTITKSLAIALSPVLAFTMEEVNDHLPPSYRTPKSIALADYPELPYDKSLDTLYTLFNKLKTEVNSGLEQLRQNKEIQSFNEAEVGYALKEGEEELKAFGEEELARLLNVSLFRLSDTNYFKRFNGERCERCWNYFTKLEVNEHGHHLCPRCLEVTDEGN